MEYLNLILSEEQIKEVIDTFEEGALLKLDSDNIQRILFYLKEQKIYYIEDILVQYLDLFLFPYDEFVEKFEQLKAKYFANFVEYLAYHFDILEEMYNNVKNFPI